MLLLSESDVYTIISKCTKSSFKILNYTLQNYADTLIGYCGAHLKLTVAIQDNTGERTMNFFVKTIPENAHVRVKEFFEKEYQMLQLLEEFGGDSGSWKWHPKSLLIRPNVFVFEDAMLAGYVMLNQTDCFGYEYVKLVVKSMARFHAGTIIYEEENSAKMGRNYSIYENYSSVLKDPPGCQNWRNVGVGAAIDYVIEFSKFNKTPNFETKVKDTVRKLYNKASVDTLPTNKFRNVIIHRDIWCNNILFSKKDQTALIIDYQTVLYTQPMMDLSLFLYINTSKDFRKNYTEEILNVYYNTLSEVLHSKDICIENIYTEDTLKRAYEDSLVFGMTQAGLILPLTALGSKASKELFSDNESIMTPLRSKKIRMHAYNNAKYKKRLLDVFDEIVEKHILI